MGFEARWAQRPPDSVWFVLRLGRSRCGSEHTPGWQALSGRRPFLKSQLFETAPTDPAVFAAVPYN